VLGHRGKTWLSAAFWLLIMFTAFWPAAGRAAGSAGFALSDWNLPVLAVSAQSPMEAQMLGERPSPSPSMAPKSYLQDIAPGLERDQLGTTFRLPQNFRISFRYNGDNSTGVAQRLAQSPLLFKYSMDYCISPNLRVGLSGFLFQPPTDHLSFLRQKNDLLMGWGPSLKYDLGRWSFTFQSQVEKARPEEDKDIQSWLRVWYAF
jgi:hypothetical protein